MLPATWAGGLILGIPLVILAWWFLRRHRAVYLFALAMIFVGLGYLAATGALHDIGTAVVGASEPAATVTPEPAAQPAAPQPAPSGGY